MTFNEVKQVIVIRKDLPMRKGKTVAQGAHASLQAFRSAPKHLVEAWDQNGYKKICLHCKDEEELKVIYNNAAMAGYPCSYIVDSGLTEFKEPTATAVAIGPIDSKLIDAITGKLPLL